MWRVKIKFSQMRPYSHPGKGGTEPAGWNVLRSGGSVEWLNWQPAYPTGLKSFEDDWLTGGQVDYETALNKVANGFYP